MSGEGERSETGSRYGSGTPYRNRRRLRIGLLAVLILLFGIDFYFDVRGRDAFSWMDPDQYYDFALGVLRGREGFTRFEIPSIFPFFVMPALAISPTIPAALWANFGFTLLLIAAICALCHELEITTPPALIASLTLSSPLLVGLSRTLYIEYALSALVALAFWAWIRFERAPGERAAFGFAFTLALGFMTKMTFPIFFVLPVAVAAIVRLRARRFREALLLMWVALLPLALVLLIEAAFFPRAFGYYLSLGNTRVPIMHWIGPPDWCSRASAGYYLGELGRSLLFLLTPLLAFPVWGGLARSGSTGTGFRQSGGEGECIETVRDDAGALRQACTEPHAGASLPVSVTLWLWLLGPPLLLIFESVKEPRHVAPCVVPAMLLVVLGVEKLPRRLARGSLALAALLAALQYGLVTGGFWAAPYFLDHSIRADSIWSRMMEADGARYGGGRQGEARALLWKYRHDLLIVGFGANEALALAWHAFPGVVFDLDSFQKPDRLPTPFTDESFEDLYIMSAFDIYNRRIGWRGRLRTLSRDAAVKNADFIILGERFGEDPAEAFPGYEPVASIDRGQDVVRILHSRDASTPFFRTLFARDFLERHPDLAPPERHVVAKELWMVDALARGGARAGALLGEFPWLRRFEPPPRNIYWLAGYRPLEQWARARSALGRMK